MILQKLVSYYERLEGEENSGVAREGYSRQKVAFEVVLEADGRLHEIRKASLTDSPKERTRVMLLPGTGKPSGSGINPNFLWDQPAYAIGFPSKGDLERTRRCFAAFRDTHLALESSVDSPGFRAVCAFLKKWDPEAMTDEQRELLGSAAGFVVFRLRRSDQHVHEEAGVKAYLDARSDPGDQGEGGGMCLVTGQEGSLARLHEPKIQGVRGAHTSGAPMVSFNEKAFESYGHEQSFNAPVGRRAAFAYCTALNHLLRFGSPQRVQIGDATTVFWTEAPTPVEGFLGDFFGTDHEEVVAAEEKRKSADNQADKAVVRAALAKIAQGVYPGELGPPEMPYYVLGLAPNNARIAVRYWREGTLADFVERLRVYMNDVMVAVWNGVEAPSVRLILAQTGREEKDIPPLLSGALMRAVLEGTPYPAALYQAVIRRIRADHEINTPRAGAIKAHLNRGQRFGANTLTREIPVSLDPERPEAAYQLGRLFAALEKTQGDALGELNATIKDRYFGAAMATPSSVFPRLIRLSQHHVGKLEGGHKVNTEKRMQEVMDRLDGFPAHLPLTDQGLFAVGYYHQRQEFFRRKPKTGEAAAAEE